MQLITFISAASAIVATASAKSAVDLNKECDLSQAYARIINRCDYPVHLWSVFRGTGCPDSDMVTLQTNDVYNENYQDPKDGVGISIKMSKTKDCKANSIVQLEYYLEKEKTDYLGNYLDMSYVDCGNEDCPTKDEGYYLQAGNQTGAAKASASNTWCPILSCDDPVSCALISYINPNDVQTKTCDLHSNTDLYLCGGEAPSGDYDSGSDSDSSSSAAASSEQATSAPEPTATSTQDSYTANLKVDVAAVTNAPEIKEADSQKTKTHVQVVYVTATKYVNAEKKHGHGHARRHQPFQA